MLSMVTVVHLRVSSSNKCWGLGLIGKEDCSLITRGVLKAEKEGNVGIIGADGRSF